MNTRFEFQAIVDQIGNELVATFAKAGRQGTTPDAVGGAREAAVFKRLESLLPPSVKVRRGHVVDARGGVSRQLDVIITEGQFCFEYNINDDESCGYFPCQGVIAVGEIKSNLDGEALQDIWKKVKSVRKLQRYARASGPDGEDTREWFRPYGSSMPVPRQRGKRHDQHKHGSDQIMAFGLTGTKTIGTERITETMKVLLRQMGKDNAPNLIGVLDPGELWVPMTHKDNEGMARMATSFLEAETLTYVQPRAAVFRWVVRKVWETYCFGFTAPAYEAMDYFDTSDGWHDRSREERG